MGKQRFIFVSMFIRIGSSLDDDLIFKISVSNLSYCKLYSINRKLL